ncbi:MAG TPA: RnfABCDGE type electron transport complex subunit D [Rhodothermales bacterium]|nr:RnfABCDGE type electron transport complex subunit D [Rhodothermales bacterium]
MTLKDQWYNVSRLGGLRRFAIAITAFNVLGHTLFGFEQSVAQPLVALAAAYGMALLIEWMDARVERRSLKFAGGLKPLVDFLLPAHITGLAVAMLLYANDRLWPIAFAAAVAIGSKTLFRVAVKNRTRHFLNPSNFGISVVLILFPWVGIAPPYHFTENLTGAADWILPAIIVCSGGYLNARFTRRWPLIATWLGVFVAQAVFRHLVFDANLWAALMPMTGVAFVLYTFYMVTDPATTPSDTRSQVFFGASVALVYSLLMMVHIVFGLFFALSLVCIGRGIGLHVQVLLARRAARPPVAVEVEEPVPVPVAAPWPVLEARLPEPEPEHQL